MNISGNFNTQAMMFLLMYIREKDTERLTSGVTVAIDATECSE
jgi:hypothetical protein